MNTHDRDANLLRAISNDAVDYLATVSDEEVDSLLVDAGVDPILLAEETKNLIEGLVKHYDQRALRAAREAHAAAQRDRSARIYHFPELASEKRRLIDLALQGRQELRAQLTAQNREFAQLADDDLDGVLRQLADLGLLPAEPGE